MSKLVKRSEKEYMCATDRFITVAELREWLALLPEEFQAANIESLVGRVPCTLKRIVAYRDKDGDIGIAFNPMGTHLPFDDSLTWEHVLS